ncbi:MAG: sigma-54 dependent transcriptional regulator [Candidatus Krumholzibacteria bacterium]|nr:sigma-54 dependent transcriptional regulator [Candidatus Krumholzibacteria bacterium]
MTAGALVRRRVLIADDDDDFRRDLSAMLGQYFEVFTVARGEAVVECVRNEGIEVVLLDIDFGEEPSGLAVLELVQGLEEPPRTIMLTAENRVEIVVRAIRAGAIDYVCKPPNLVELIHKIERCLDELALQRKTRLLSGRLEQASGELIAEDPLSLRIVRQVEKVAPTDTTVLLTGDSGTGKEMVALRLHQRSRRAREVFLPVNCTAISPNLMESTLFGHMRGAFTGADSDHPGQFELADGGTLFLDEIGDSPPDLQQKLLRVIESGRFQRVGGNKEIAVNVRLIAATNRDLEALRAAGRFRDDLYHRINVYRIHLPPLRERPGDIMPLAMSFLARYAVEQGKPVCGFSEQAAEYLQSASWPGNVRDLRNTIERAVINCEGERIRLTDLTVGGAGAKYAMLTREDAKKRAEREFYVSYLSAQLELAGGSVKEAARRSGVLPSSFSRLCKDYGVRVGDEEQG